MSERAGELARVVDRRAWPFAVALALVHLGLGLYAAHREGSWQQGPSVDQSGDLCAAVAMKRAIEMRGVGGLLQAWIHSGSIHTPLVPMASALLMLVFGESRLVAEAVLPLSTMLLAGSTFRVVERLYDARTAFAATALTTAFPVFLIFWRTYLFEHPLAAVFMAACWAMLATERFTRTKPAIVFGVLAGLVAVTRGGAPVFLIGPTLVAAAVALRERPRGPRLARLALATAIGGAIAASWYVPNWKALTDYYWSVTYGPDAERVAGGWAFSSENAQYYLHWIVAQGPGFPMAVIAAIAWLVRPTLRPIPLLLLAAFAIDFVLLLAAAQREGARYFQPLMPILAVWVVRAVAGVPWTAARRAFAAAVGACAIHHVLALTILFPVPSTWNDGLGPDPEFPWWDHRTWYLGVAMYSRMEDPRADMRVPAVVDRLEELTGPTPKRFYLASSFHGFFNMPGLSYEIQKRHERHYGTDSPYLDADRASWLARVERDLEEVDVVLARSDEAKHADDEGALVRTLFDPAWCLFTEVGEPIRLGDGSIVRSFRRAPRAELRSEPPPGLAPHDAVFGGGSDPTLELIGTDVVESPRGLRIALAFRVADAAKGIPILLVQAIGSGGQVAEQDFPAIPIEGAAGPAIAVVQLRFREPIPDAARDGGVVLTLVLRRRDDHRLTVRSDRGVDESGTRVPIGRVPPRPR